MSPPLAAGDRQACAVTSTCTAKCWGANTLGELGDGLKTSGSDVSVTVHGLTDVTAIAAGFDLSCALTAAGRVECWGANFLGTLGDGSTTGSDVPVAVKTLTSR